MSNVSRGVEWGDEMTEALKLVTDRGGLFNLFANGGNLPEHAVKDVTENGAPYTHITQTVIYSYLVDKERLGLQNNYVSIEHFPKKIS